MCSTISKTPTVKEKAAQRRSGINYRSRLEQMVAVEKVHSSSVEILPRSLTELIHSVMPRLLSTNRLMG